ncbi:hypothetical protein WICMUC_001192 [Wickerhamomyces mucosus]|uniref:Uncharacterized protein n=1 Tax=Wickerhamomyces mucosus TaxID=1378264 RepID=A0A9P8PVP4_9ASCO|nr:hypothetical protein WICMUC_001192 [Wickerhamomyces mucosus]
MLKASTIFKRGIKTIHKEIKFRDDARLSILKGASKLYNAVSITLGPKGRNVLMEQKYNFPKITKDGYSIAQEIYTRDRFENMGIQLMKDIITKTNLQSGDGTTTTTVLSYEILKHSLKKVSVGCNPIEIRKGIEIGVQKVLEFLEAKKTNIEKSRNDEELKNIATISCNGDTELGNLIYESIKTVGENGIVTIEENTKFTNELVLKSGLRFDKGYFHENFANNDIKTKKVELFKPLILLHRGSLISAQQILPALHYAKTQQRSLLIITDDLEGDAFAIASLNKLQRQVQLCVIKSPGFADYRFDNLNDLEILTNSTIVNSEIDEIASSAEPHFFGKDGVDSVIITNDETIIINDSSKINKDSLKRRIEEVEAALKKPNISIGDKDHLKQRLLNLSIDLNSTATIKVGGGSKFEIKEKKDRLDDALNSTYSALENGVLPGGGIALFKASHYLAELDRSDYTFDTQVGIKIVQDSIKSPCLKIIQNANFSNELSIITKLSKHNNDFNKGVNIATGETGVDMIRNGVIDPYNTIKYSLTNAASITSLLATSQVAITSVLGEKEGFD